MNETMTTIVGNVVSELRSRRTADGVRLVSFRVASNERRFDRASAEWVDGDHLFVSVTCWRKLALGVLSSLSKGDPVVVTGRLYSRAYEVEGQRRSVTELEATTVGPDLSRCTADVRRMVRAAEDPATENSATENSATENSMDAAPATDRDGADGTSDPAGVDEQREPSAPLVAVG